MKIGLFLKLGQTSGRTFRKWMQNILWHLSPTLLQIMHNMEEKDLQPHKYHLLTIVALSGHCCNDRCNANFNDNTKFYGSNYPRLKLFFFSSFEDV